MLGKVRGNNTIVDERIPTSYLIRLALSKCISLIWGTLRLRTFKRAYIHPSSTIKGASYIKFKKNLIIGQDCYVDAMSLKGLECGENVSVGFHTHLELTGSMQFIGNGMEIGNNVGLGSHGHYGSGKGFVEIGDDTIFGNYVSIHPENHIADDLEIPIRLQGVKSNGGVTIG